MNRKTVFRNLAILALILLALWGWSVMSDSGREYRGVDTSVALQQLNDKNTKFISIDDREQQLRALAASWCVSSDVGHAVHPNCPDKHDPVVQPLLGRGPILKINANQRYATDAAGAAAWHGWCAAASVTSQEFVSNNAVPCGSTIGPITATRLGIRTVDVGIPILSMHSARELAGTADLHALRRVASEFFAGRHRRHDER